MADYKARWNQAVILRGAPNRHNEPCRRRAFVLGARTVRFPLANPAAECRLRSVQSESAFGIGPSVRISHRTAELGRRVFAQLKRAIHRDIRLRDNVNSDRFAREDL